MIDALYSIGVFEFIEVVDGIAGDFGALLLSILKTVDATDVAKIALRDVFLTNDEDGARNFFRLLDDTPIVAALEKLDAEVNAKRKRMRQMQ